MLTVLLKRPGNVLKEQYFQVPGGPADPLPLRLFKNLPTNRPWGYKPSIKGVPGMEAGQGATNPITGDIEYSIEGSLQKQQLARAHELVHQALTPKLNLLRELHGFARAQGYNRSYVLRYLEEALCETVAQLRVKGLSKTSILDKLTPSPEPK